MNTGIVENLGYWVSTERVPEGSEGQVFLRGKSVATFTTSAAVGRNRSYGEEALIALRDGFPEWQHGLEEALGRRPPREDIRRELEVSIQWAESNSEGSRADYVVVLEWRDLQDQATKISPGYMAFVLYSPCGVVLQATDPSFEGSLPLFRLLAKIVGVDWRMTVPHLPIPIALKLLEGWREMVTTIEQQRERERGVPQSRHITAAQILKRIDYLIATLAFDMVVMFRGIAAIEAHGPSALAAHLRTLSEVELPQYLSGWSPEIYTPLEPILGVRV